MGVPGLAGLRLDVGETGARRRLGLRHVIDTDGSPTHYWVIERKNEAVDAKGLPELQASCNE